MAFVPSFGAASAQARRSVATCVVMRPQTQTGSRSLSAETATKLPVKVIVEVAKKETERRVVQTAPEDIAPVSASDVGLSESIVNRGIVIFADYLSDLIVLDILDRMESEIDLFLVVMGTFAAYFLADLTSGLYYWLAHNYGSFETPVFGAEIQKIRQLHTRYTCACTNALGHHCARCKGEGNSEDFFASVGNHCLVAIPFLTVLAGWQPNNLGLEAFCVMFLSILAILPQVKRWSQMRKPPLLIRILQKTRLIGGKQPHTRFDSTRGSDLAPKDNYCFGSVWNHILDKENVFRRLEQFLYISTNGWLSPRWKAQQDAKVDALAEDAHGSEVVGYHRYRPESRWRRLE
eukprot:CAMPEP_0198734750 /NCGR_PEP_ID=MMETSP1475-20131203/55018_1 /TAXON_ID= ORGANISM="Unidentified sp., Strain CCMP1999" /NCGR_SAMPLE_ID=MMETSP1475 /ASSEMBLY_ACC=CAM_ASM_001111 /LENGTH=347 /DNA_ID=CAMNT_0044498285 /DNA_START=45 /DNA_END=1088 /DNA_ORIENTATION=-